MRERLVKSLSVVPLAIVVAGVVALLRFSANGQQAVRLDKAAVRLDGGAGGTGATPGGSNGQVQFNNSGAFGGATYLSYSSATGVTTAINSMVVKAGLGATTDPTGGGVRLDADANDALRVTFSSSSSSGKALAIDGVALSADRTWRAPNASIGIRGALLVSYANQATTGTTEQTLASYSLPPNTLGAITAGLRVRAFFSTAGNGNNKTFKLTFGSATMTTATRPLNNGFIRAEATVFRTGASAQYWFGEYLSGTASTWDSESPSAGTMTETDTSAITIAVKGTTPTASGDLTLKAWTVEVLTAP